MKLVIMHGDGTGEELLEQAQRVIQPLGIEVVDYDLSLENRSSTENRVVHEAAEAVREHGVGVKAATDTVQPWGSPNRILREVMDAHVILRRGEPLLGIEPRLRDLDRAISIVRMATGDAYGAHEERGYDEHGGYARRIETIRQSSCDHVADYAFRLAREKDGIVLGGTKYTVSPVYEAMLQEALERASEDNPGVEYWPTLIDATYAAIITNQGQGKELVIPTLNRDGDCLADLVLPLYGSIAGASSQIISMDDTGEVCAVLHEAAHGTAPTLKGLDVANPLAMVLSFAGAVDDLIRLNPSHPSLPYTGVEIRKAAHEALSAGVRTGDLGGSAKTSEYVDAVLAGLPAVRV
jgi:isocitrate/isopropylmalate dehydrogenase